MKAVQGYIQEHRDRFLDELVDLLKIPSISADTAYAEQVKSCAEWVADRLREAGAENVCIEQTAGHPIVYADKMIDPQAPTILIYGHYDVQPPDPLELWTSEPFAPVVKQTAEHPEGALFARGASDDKGQCFMHIKAFEALNRTDSLPCNVKFVIEGEEEIGSPSLEHYVVNQRERLANDVILISDTRMISNEQPAITVGLRGLSYVEVVVSGPARDLHSGLYGGAVANPINVLVDMIAKLHDADLRVNIPGFYGSVKAFSTADRAAIAAIPFDLGAYEKSIGIPAVQGERDYSTLERASIRPTLDVNGIWGGYTAEGSKTVIPAEAHAKISMRLVPDQDPREITARFTEHFLSLAPEGVKVKVTPHHGAEPYVMPTDSIGYRAAEQACAKTFERKALPVYGGGSIPIVTMFERELRSKSILMGFGLASDAVHAPNEHFGLFNFYKGIETLPYFHHFYRALHGAC